MTSSTNLFYTFVLFLDISLQQYCDQIDQIEASVSKLEQTAYRLGQLRQTIRYNRLFRRNSITYSIFVESKFKALEKRN